MKNVVFLLLTISTLGFASAVSLSVEQDSVCKNMCNTEIAGQVCIAKGGAFSGPTWLATEWVSAKPEINLDTIRIIPTTDRWINVREIKLYVKNAEGIIEEKLITLGLNRIHNCEILNIKMNEKINIIDMEMFVRGSAESIDIGTKLAE